MREWANSDMRLTPVFIGLTALWLWSAPLTAQQEREPFVTPLTLDQMRDKQAVVETTEGTFVIDLLPEVAPNHVGLFMRMIEDGVYDGTIFHSMVARGIVQGGDPLTKDPARADVYGRGGLGLIDAEPNDEQHIAGTVSAVVVPGDPDSGGTQFLICVVAQPALDGHHTIWGRVSEGLPVVTRISLTPTDAEGNAQGRVEILSVSIRAAVPPPPVPFTTETVEELSSYRAVLDTDAGPVTIEVFADRAPEHVRNFLRLADAGVYDGTAFHRVVPGFVIQTGWIPSRLTPLTEEQQSVVGTVEPELSDTPHVEGIVSMARGDDEASASTSFFIVTGAADELDGVYRCSAGWWTGTGWCSGSRRRRPTGRPRSTVSSSGTSGSSASTSREGATECPPPNAAWVRAGGLAARGESPA